MRLKVLFAMLLSLCAIPAFAQFKATIQGTVLDPNGGAVAHAKVTVTNQATGVVQNTVASAEGYYRITELPPGKYTVEVEAGGFKKSVSKDVVVEAEQPRGLDVSLEIGAVAEQVTVTASQAELQTQDASISTTITTEQIERLPQYGRDPFELLKLAPGVFGDGSRASGGLSANLPNSGGPGGSNHSVFSVENQVQVVANGQRNSGNNFTIDGTSVNSLTWSGAAILTPNQESIQELTVVANNYSAEDGRNTGAQVKVVSKNGTNQFHGSGFFKVDSPGLNAKTRWGGPDGQAPQKDQTNARQFGGSLGGPVMKDKLFFFFSYEGNRLTTTQLSSARYVETQALRDFITANRAGTTIGDLISAKGSLPRIAQVLPLDPTPGTGSCKDFGNLNDPSTCQVVNGGIDLGSVSPAPGCSNLGYGQYVNIFGGNGVDHKTFAGCGLDGIPDLQKVILSVPTQFSGNQYNARMDYNMGKNLFAASFYITPANSSGGDLGADGRPMADLSFNPRNKYVALIWNRTISPTMTNEARANWTRYIVDQFASNRNLAWNVPRFEIESMPFARIGFGVAQGTNSPARLAQNTFEYRDTLSKLTGRHALKFGFVADFNQDNNNYEFGAARPIYVAHGLWNFVNGAPIYEGINVDPRTGVPTDVHKYYRQHDYAAFVQDDIKVRANFSLNIGLRYEYFAPLREKFNRQSNLILGSGPNPLTTATLKVGGPLYPADKNNFAPRLGFAWTPSKYITKTVVRAGFGVAYNRIADTVSGITRVDPPFLFREGACCAMSVQDQAANTWGQKPFYPTPAGNLIVVTDGQSNNPLSWPGNPAIAATFNPATGLPLAGSLEIWGASQAIRTPYTYLYSAEVQHELPGQLVLTVGYQGSQSRKMLRIVGENRVYPGNAVLSPAYFLVADVNGHYNALNVNAIRRFSNGFQFLGKYTFSRSMDAGSWEGAGGSRDPYFPANHIWDYGPSDFDATHNVLLSALYELPIFRNRHDFVGKALGGWQINGTFQFHTGFPWSPVQSNNCPPSPAGPLCPSLVAAYLGGGKHDYSSDTFKKPGGNFPGVVFQGEQVPDPANPGKTIAADCGNPAKSTQPGYPYFDGCTAGPPFVHRNSFRGPRYKSVDASFAKSTGLPFFGGETAKLDLRVNFYNLFNNLNLQPFGKNDGSTSLNDPHFGQAQAVLSGRVIEFQARLVF
jgi:hypothetical protein